jgi:F-type H+-transporting ATPase subunit epsilon
MDPSKLIYVEIITPKHIVFKGEVVDFAAPGVIGGFEILRNHTDFISAMTIGEIRVREEDGYDDFFATSGGFVDVHDNKVTVLAETCEKASDIDINRAKEAHEKALKKMEERSSYDVEQVKKALLRAQNRISIAEKRLKNHFGT